VPFADLRECLSAQDGAGQLARVTEEVGAEPDLEAAATRLGEAAPALCSESVRGFGPVRIAANVHGSWANHAVTPGLDPRTPGCDQAAEFARRSVMDPVAPEYRADPPFAQNTLDGDLFRVLPLFRWNPGDGGFFIDKAAVVSRDPDDPDDFGKQNAGIYRMPVKGRRRPGLQPVPMHDIAAQLRVAEARGEDLPVAIAIGNDPVVTIAAAMPLAYDQSEYAMAGALRQAPVPSRRPRRPASRCSTS
jgi:4-hydroxybenzoate decarboxylase